MCRDTALSGGHTELSECRGHEVHRVVPLGSGVRVSGGEGKLHTALQTCDHPGSDDAGSAISGATAVLANTARVCGCERGRFN